MPSCFTVVNSFRGIKRNFASSTSNLKKMSPEDLRNQIRKTIPKNAYKVPSIMTDNVSKITTDQSITSYGTIIPGVHVIYDFANSTFIKSRVKTATFGLCSALTTAAGVKLIGIAIPNTYIFGGVIFSFSVFGFSMLCLSRVISRIVVDSRFGRAAFYFHNLGNGKRAELPMQVDLTRVSNVTITNKSMQVSVKKGFPILRTIPYFLRIERPPHQIITTNENHSSTTLVVREKSLILPTDFPMMNPHNFAGATSAAPISKEMALTRDLIGPPSIGSITAQQLAGEFPVVQISKEGMLLSGKEDHKVAMILSAWKKKQIKLE